jgi:hypothetical protein
MTIFTGAVYVVGWFLLCVSALFMLVSMLRGKATYLALAFPFLVVVGLPVFFAGSYLRSHVDSPSPLLFWEPAVLSGICGGFAGYGNEKRG